MRALAISAGSIFIAAFSAHADDGCSKDTDCKAERVCVQRQCVDPVQNASSKSADAAPATFQPAPVISSQPQAPSPAAGAAALDTRRRHFGGFFRPDLGFGYLNMSTSSSGTDASIGGVAGTFGIAFGGAVSENNILAFHLWDLVVTSPTLTYGSQSISNADATLTAIAFGPEYTRYFADNYYFAITPSLTRATISANGSSSDTNWGFGLRAGLGKEWWVGDHWGLGLVGHLSFTVNQDGGTNPPTWTGWSGTIAFSATYN